MKCNFCGHEVERGTVECPYCHYQFTVEAEELPSDERDSFEGITIEEDGSTNEAPEYEQTEERSEYDPNHKFGQQPTEEEQYQQQQQPFQVKTYGCGGLSLMIVMILVAISVLAFFMMPVVLVFGAIGAIIVFLFRTFLPF